VRGSPRVIEMLNEVLTAELTAINQYFIHAKMCANWGYDRLGKHHRDESIGEMKDADELIERILYLDGVPNMQRLGTVMVGETVTEQLTLDLDTEREAIERLNRAIALAVEEGDNGSRDLFEDILEGEEEHADWLESQLHVIGEIGEANYLAQQLYDDD
jgi:bacterioferritin